MPKIINFAERAEQVHKILLRYNGIPSQTVDRNAHSMVTRFIKQYGNEPLVRSLKEEFKIEFVKRKPYEERISEIRAQLEARGCMPDSSQENTMYKNISQYFMLHPDEKEVIELRFIYATVSTFPLSFSRFGFRGYRWKYTFAYTPEDIAWERHVSLEYIEYVYTYFNKLPAPKTHPMKVFQKLISLKQEDRLDEELSNMLRRLIHVLVDRGCDDSLIIDCYKRFDCSKVPLADNDYSTTWPSPEILPKPRLLQGKAYSALKQKRKDEERLIREEMERERINDMIAQQRYEEEQRFWEEDMTAFEGDPEAIWNID